MLEIILNLIMYLGAILAIALLVGLWVLCLFFINEESNAVFKHRRNDRFANKLFRKIEEYRNDFA